MERLARTRLPQPAPADDWTTGTPNSYLRDAVEQWRTSFDWRAEEQRINSVPHFITEINGAPIHFIHVKSERPDAKALLLAHNYPGSSVDYLGMIEHLRDFDLVIPDAPGYGFSNPVADAGWTSARVAEAYDALMRRLGYSQYASTVPTTAPSSPGSSGC
jgi:Epoxide hydrolase N terminus.